MCNCIALRGCLWCLNNSIPQITVPPQPTFLLVPIWSLSLYVQLQWLGRPPSCVCASPEITALLWGCLLGLEGKSLHSLQTAPWAFAAHTDLLWQHKALPLDCAVDLPAMMDTFYICAVRCSAHQPLATAEQLKCGWCDGESEFKILLSLNQNDHLW